MRFIATSLLAASAVLAVPTPPNNEIEASPDWNPMIIPINVYPNAFDFSVNYARPGDILQFHFMPGYSSVVESTFEKPCSPRKFGFSVAPIEVNYYEALDVFRVVVLDYNPIWFYNGASNQCNEQGAVGVVNPPWPYDQPFYDFREAAREQTETIDPRINANGFFAPNPRFRHNQPKPSTDENTEEAENTEDGSKEPETSQAVNSEAEQAEALETEEAKMAEAQMAEEAQEAALARQKEKGKQVAEPEPTTPEETNTPQEAAKPERTRKKVSFAPSLHSTGNGESSSSTTSS
ncbi:hypothetical protein Cpir12675_001590 [Ceratocystis pirilliformis]|uniref:Extracellular serine-rich protein n=1 Tax=Ceratocystis pirilliformis TaxID=259994 RepID=A0ABR3ZF98_9PEZI